MFNNFQLFYKRPMKDFSKGEFFETRKEIFLLSILNFCRRPGFLK